MFLEGDWQRAMALAVLKVANDPTNGRLVAALGAPVGGGITVKDLANPVVRRDAVKAVMLVQRVVAKAAEIAKHARDEQRELLKSKTGRVSVPAKPRKPLPRAVATNERIKVLRRLNRLLPAVPVQVMFQIYPEMRLPGSVVTGRRAGTLEYHVVWDWDRSLPVSQAAALGLATLLSDRFWFKLSQCPACHSYRWRTSARKYCDTKACKAAGYRIRMGRSPERQKRSKSTTRNKSN
ncbi:MAG TPA: hypothetical protein VN812_04900 [Candidatus Acidoferrales bacterium]|nr:hypothetical protein [Candidatus Acidoferrales bacterium]